MIALFIILGVLALLFLLLLAPVSFEIEYGMQLTVVMRYLFFKRRIAPPEEKKPKKEKQAEEKKEPEEEKPKASMRDKLKAALKAEGFKGFMKLLGDFVKLTGTAAVKILRHVYLKDFDLYVMTCGEDAAQAAIFYGQISGAVYSAAEVLFRFVKCKKRRVSVDLDYNVKEPYVMLSTTARIRPLFPLCYGVQYLIRALPFLKRFK